MMMATSPRRGQEAITSHQSASHRALAISAQTANRCRLPRFGQLSCRPWCASWSGKYPLICGMKVRKSTSQVPRKLNVYKDCDQMYPCSGHTLQVRVIDR